MSRLHVKIDDWLQLCGWVHATSKHGWAYTKQRCHQRAYHTGTVLAITDNYLAACAMQPRNRLIGHMLIPLETVDRPISELFTLDVPPGLAGALRRFRGQTMSLEFLDERAFLRLPGKYKRQFSFPMKRVAGRMVSPLMAGSAYQEIRIDARELRAALDRVNPRVKSAGGCLAQLSLVVGPDGAALWSVSDIVAIHQILRGVTPTRVLDTVQFSLQLNHRQRLRDLLSELGKHHREVNVRINEEQLILWNPRCSTILYSDVPPVQCTKLDIPFLRGRGVTSVLVDETTLISSPQHAEACRSLLTTRKNSPYRVPPVRWVLSQDSLELTLRNHMVEMPLEASCQCQDWNLEKPILEADIHPKATAAMLRAVATIPGPYSLLYQPEQLHLRSEAEGFEIITFAERNVKPLRHDAFE